MHPSSMGPAAASDAASAATKSMDAASPAMGMLKDTRRPARSTTTCEPALPVASRATRRTSAPRERPNVTHVTFDTRAARPMTAGSSALATRTPPVRTLSNSAPFSRATSSRVPPTPPAWAMPILTMTPTSGAAMSPRAAISPGRLIPISSTAYRWSDSSCRTTAGSPTLLFKFPAVAWQPATDARSAAHISFVVVLPALPVMPRTRRRGSAARQACRWSRAMSPHARSVSSTSTTSAAASAGARPRATTRSAAPDAMADCRKSWPSCVSP